MRPFIGSDPFLDMTFNNVIARICVPYFLFITGYFISNKENGYIKKYIWVLIKLYLIWWFIYLPLGYLYLYIHPEVLNGISISFIEALIISLVYVGSFYHLWYFPAVIIGLLIVDKVKDFNYKWVMLIAILLLILGATETYYGLLPLVIKRVLDFYYNTFHTTRNFLFFGFFYLWFGFVVGKKGIKENKSLVRFLISFILLYIEAYLLRRTPRLNSNIMIMSIPTIYYLFIYLMSRDDINFFKFKHSLNDLSKYYYLVSPMVIFGMSYFTNIFINNIFISILNIFIVIFITHYISCAIIKLERRGK